MREITTSFARLQPGSRHRAALELKATRIGRPFPGVRLSLNPAAVADAPPAADAARQATVKSLGSFERYLAWVVATPHPFAKGATKFQKDALTDAEDRLLVDFVGRYETLTSDFAQVCDHLQLQVELPHVNKSAHRDYRAYYSEHTRQLVAEHFAADISLFGYTFENSPETSRDG
jgi:hypothetical protein